MLTRVVELLRCPVCKGALVPAAGALVCARRHTFDRARHGYVSLLTSRERSTGDTPAMVADRERVLRAGHFEPLAAAIARQVQAHTPDDGVVIEPGAGTAYYLAACMDGDRCGLALDRSKYAARRAARAHPRVLAAVADVALPWPVADGAADAVIDVFAPRHAGEFERVLRPSGVLVVVTPDSEHLAELRAHASLLLVDPAKQQRLERALDGRFTRVDGQLLSWPMELDGPTAAALVGMGPSARHLDPGAAAKLASLPGVAVTGRVHVALYRPRV